MPVAFDPTADLRSYIAALRGECHAGALLDVMRRTRQVLESDKLRSIFPILALYCDWHLHHEIDRHELGWSILSQINSIMCDAAPADPARSIGRALGLAELREEFQLLYRSRQVMTFLFDDNTNWAKFGGLLLQALSNKRLKWPAFPLKGKVKKVHQQMMQRVLRSELYPRELYIDHRPSGHEGPGYYWIVELSDGPHSVTAVGQLVASVPSM